jgi:hypothetical protein
VSPLRKAGIDGVLSTRSAVGRKRSVTKVGFNLARTTSGELPLPTRGRARPMSGGARIGLPLLRSRRWGQLRLMVDAGSVDGIFVS